MREYKWIIKLLPEAPSIVDYHVITGSVHHSFCSIFPHVSLHIMRNSYTSPVLCVCVSESSLPAHLQSLIIPGKSPTRKKSGPFSSRRSSAIGIENIQEVQERRWEDKPELISSEWVVEGECSCNRWKKGNKVTSKSAIRRQTSQETSFCSMAVLMRMVDL